MNNFVKYSLPIGATVLLSMGAISPAFADNTTVIAGSAGVGLQNFTDLGDANSASLMDLTVLLKLNNQAQLQQQIASGKKITPAQFHQNYSPDGNSYNAVVNQLQNAGFTVLGMSDNNMVVDVEGPVSAVESTFGTTVHQFQRADGSTFLANTTDFHVTGALAAHLSGVVGADELANVEPMNVQSNSSILPKATDLKSNRVLFNGSHSANIQSSYDFQPVYDSGLDGSGQTIAIVDAYGSPTIQSDLARYQQTVEQGAFGANDPLNLTVMAPPGLNVKAEKNKNVAPKAANWAGEVSMDVELSHAAAPGANILLVATPNNGSDLYMGVNQVVDKHLANQISLSFGSPEQYTPSAERNAIDQIFEQAVAEGINVFVSSGDWGDFGETTAYRLPNPAVSFPASDPNVVAVGGSTLFTNADSSYNSEVPWGDTFRNPDGTFYYNPSYGINGFWSGTGGGTSSVYAKPSWQTGVTGLSNTSMRQVPDVGYNADPWTGFTVITNGQSGVWGGTSDAAPQWAAINALANEGYAQKNNGAALPFIDPILYQDGQSAFHDVTGSKFPALKYNLNGKTVYLWFADDTTLTGTTGWDDTTGLGTPDVAKVVNELVNSN